MKRRPGESVEDFTTRARVVVDGCVGIGIGMHPVMMTCLLLESSGISQSEKSLILATTNGSLEFNTVLSTLRQLYGKSKVFAHDSANLVETPESVMFVKNRNSPGVKGGKGAGKVARGMQRARVPPECVTLADKPVIMPETARLIPCCKMYVGSAVNRDTAQQTAPRRPCTWATRSTSKNSSGGTRD